MSKHKFLLIFGIYWKDLFLAFAAVLFLLTFIPIFTYYVFAKDLVSEKVIMNHNDSGVVLLDRYGNPFFTFYQAKHKDPVSLPEISINAQKAVIAIEDKDFYRHPGFSIKAIIRSFYLDVLSQNFAYGGSTITQQLVKNSLLSSNKDLLRKYQEIALAYELERRYSKNQILGMYLNSVYFGDGAFGIEEASETYFGKKASDLNLAEASMLAGLLPAPSKYSPLTGSLKEAKIRQEEVLKDMYEQGYISKVEMEQAKNQKLVFYNGSDINTQAPHFALYVKDELIKKYGEEQIARSGYRVKTSLDLSKQVVAEEEVKNQVEKLAPNGATNGAAVVIDPKTGEILAMVGSYDWYDNKFGKQNMAISPRQPGSSFKPIYYVAAFEEGLITPATILQDVPTVFPINYKPKDYDGRYRGPVTVRRVLSNSLNIPSVEVLQKLGIPLALEMATRLGITTLNDPSRFGLSLALGAGEVKLVEMTDAYATFANQGIYNQPTSILDIEDKNGNVIYKYKQENESIIAPQYTFLISSILSDNNSRAEEFGNTLTISRPAAVKTGTSEDYRDAWTIGYTPSLAVGVWVGNNDNHPMDNIAGSLGAAPIWRNLMEDFLKGTSIEKFTPPSGIVYTRTCNNYGMSSKQATSSANFEYFAEGTQPTQSCITPTLSPKLTAAISVSQTPMPTLSITSTPLPTLTLAPSIIPVLSPTIPVTQIKPREDNFFNYRWNDYGHLNYLFHYSY